MTDDTPDVPGEQPERPQQSAPGSLSQHPEQPSGQPSAQQPEQAATAATTPVPGPGSAGDQSSGHAEQRGEDRAPDQTVQPPAGQPAGTESWTAASAQSAGAGYSPYWAQQQQHWGQPYPGQTPYAGGYGGQPGQYGGQSGQTPSSPWQPGAAPGPQYAGTPGDPQSSAHVGLHTAPPPRSRSKLVVGAVVLALIVGGASGGIGGVVGYDLAKQNSQSVNSLYQPKPPANPTSGSTPGSVAQVAQKLLPSVVELQVSGQQGSGDGSGIVLSSDGLILTNNHVVADAAGGGQIAVVFQDGKTVPADIVGTAPNSDLAVVRAKGVSGLAPAQLGRSDDLAVGQQVVAFGSPFGLNGTVTSGIVSALQRPVRAGGQNGDQATVIDAIQTDAPINPGNSGGPLVDMQGNVIGIDSAIYSPQTVNGQAGSVGLGFAIPIDQARRVAQQLTSTGKATQALLNIKVDGQSTGGAKVHDVTAGGAADKAGIKVGDTITQLDNRRITDGDTLIAAVRAHAPGDKVKITLADGRTVDVTLDSGAS